MMIISVMPGTSVENTESGVVQMQVFSMEIFSGQWS